MKNISRVLCSYPKRCGRLYCFNEKHLNFVSLSSVWAVVQSALDDLALEPPDSKIFQKCYGVSLYWCKRNMEN